LRSRKSPGNKGLRAVKKRRAEGGCRTPTSGEEVRTFSGHTDAVNIVAVSPNGRLVLTGSADDTARLWDAASGDEVRAYRM